jgi:capsular polysaccharide biosynthesis protein
MIAAFYIYLVNHSEFLAQVERKFLADRDSWGELIAAMWMKQQVCREVGVEAAFPFCRKMLSRLPSSERLRRRDCKPLISAAAAPGNPFTVVAKGGVDFTAPPTKIIGINNNAPFHGRSRAYYTSCLHNCIIRGRSTLVLQDESALVDAEADEAQLPDNYEYDPWVLHGNANYLWTMESEQWDDAPVIEEGLFLANRLSHEFGHWITELIPKIGIAGRAGLDPSLPVIIDASTKPTCRHSLDVFLPKRKSTIVLRYLLPCKVKKLWVVSNPWYAGFYPTTSDLSAWTVMAAYGLEYALAIKEALNNAHLIDGTVRSSSYVFLARKPDNPKKKLANQSDVEHLARRAGFLVVYPEDLSFLEQVSLVRGASHILGPEGSNMLLPFLAKEGTKVCCLNSPYTYPLADVSYTYAELGIDYTVLTGDFVENDPGFPFWNGYQIDIHTLSSFLSYWLS